MPATPEPAATTALQRLQSTLGYTFYDESLLAVALTHPSCAQESPQAPTNQRLEFLGDAVLGFILAEALYRDRPEDREGALTKARSQLARGKQLAELARKLGIAEVLRVSEAERALNGHRRAAALEDALEAIVGAIYLDGGIEAARLGVLHWFGDMNTLLEDSKHHSNAKGRLQEHLQGNGQPPPEYHLVRSKGPDHNRIFYVEVRFGGECRGTGEGSSIKAAEEQAAMAAMAHLPE